MIYDQLSKKIHVKTPKLKKCKDSTSLTEENTSSTPKENAISPEINDWDKYYSKHAR